jgi:predicted Zn-dependent protease
VLPEFVTITDEPSRQSWQGKSLTGYQIVDDEGVKCQDITVVEKGRLVNLPMTRQPTKKIPFSNGHARSTAYQLVLPGISNLLVSSTQPKDKLVDELRRLCKEQDVEFGLLVTRLDEPRFDRDYQWTEREEDGKIMLTAPVVAYKVFAKDGRTEAVRGLTFDELSVMTLRTVAALGKDVKAYNMTQPTMYEESMYPASIITPSILVEEMELKASAAYEPTPVAENPIFGK